MQKKAVVAFIKLFDAQESQKQVAIILNFLQF